LSKHIGFYNVALLIISLRLTLTTDAFSGFVLSTSLYGISCCLNFALCLAIGRFYVIPYICSLSSSTGGSLPELFPLFGVRRVLKLFTFFLSFDLNLLD